MSFTTTGDGYVSGTSTGCLSDPLHGLTGKVVLQGKAHVVTAYGTALAGKGLTFVIRNDRTFYIEKADGTGTVVNNGTWSPGTPGTSLKGAKPAGLK